MTTITQEEYNKAIDIASAYNAQEGAKDSSQVECKHALRNGLKEQLNVIRNMITKEKRDELDTLSDRIADAQSELSDLKYDTESTINQAMSEYNYKVQEYNELIEEIEEASSGIWVDKLDESFKMLKNIRDTDNGFDEVPDNVISELEDTLSAISDMHGVSCAEEEDEDMELECLPSDPEQEICSVLSAFDELEKALNAPLIDDQVKKEVESWGNNMTVFEVYDTLKDWDAERRRTHLQYAKKFYDKDKCTTGYGRMIHEVAHQWNV